MCFYEAFVQGSVLGILLSFCASIAPSSQSPKTLVPIIMTIDELHNKLTDLEILADQYYLHGLYGSTDDNDKVALTMKRGKYMIKYEVYYKERGEKHSIQNFADENEACNYILKKFTKK